MWIEQVSVENFRLFEKRSFSFHPQFNLVVGENGSGKTSLMYLLAICVSAWVDDISTPENIKNFIFPNDILRTTTINYDGELRLRSPNYLLIHTQCQGIPPLNSQMLASRWNIRYHCNNEDGIISSSVWGFGGARYKDLIFHAIDFILPLFAHYPCNRLWQSSKSDVALQMAMEAKYSRTSGYSDWEHAKNDASELELWLQKLDIIAYQEKTEPLGWRVFQSALRTCFEDFDRLHFMAKEGQAVAIFEDGRSIPFKQLSDGQRTIFAMIGDLVRRAVLLNPQLGEKVLEETPGVVLIDELDLHLHPKWQRRIIEDLRRTFPKIQFICTTHSPFLIQSLRSGEELIMLDGQPTAELGNLGIEEIARGIMGVSRPEVSERYEEMKAVARNYLETLELADKTPEDKLEAFKQELAKSIAPYADNPAFQAFLEMKRAAKLGE